MTVQRDSEPAASLEGVRPSGKRSTKRDLIVNVFLRQEGALTADDLFDLIRREDSGKGDGHPAVDGISRATVYRTLQWMADAGIARKVDFAGGRIRFEHSYRHPRHFHLICKTCNQSFEFLSSDIESLIEEVAGARNFAARQSVLQIHGTCEACRTGRPAPSEGGSTERVFARDALRIAIATERSGLEFYSRAATMTRDPRGRRVFQKLATEDRARLSRLEERYRELVQQDSQLEARPTFLFFKGAANGLFAAATLRLENRLDVRQALMMAIRCERGSHRFFKRYGDKFEDSEGKKIFLLFADEERAHLELLIREYRALSGARRRARGARGSTRRPRREPAVVR